MSQEALPQLYTGSGGLASSITASAGAVVVQRVPTDLISGIGRPISAPKIAKRDGRTVSSETEAEPFSA